MIKELTKPYMKWGFESITKTKNLFKELSKTFPEIEPKINFSSIDESILTEEDIEGNEFKRTYILKSSQNNKKFEYKHSLKEEDDIHDIREKAWENLEAWKFSIEQQKLNQIENGKEE
jgi:hypothetical protein